MFTSIIRRFDRLFEAMRSAVIGLVLTAELPKVIKQTPVPKEVLSVIPVVCHVLKAGVRHPLNH